MSDQTAFDFLVPHRKQLLRPDEAAKCFGRSVDFVYALIAEGRLETHAPVGRQVERHMITRRSVVLALAEQARYEPGYFVERLEAVLDHLTPAQLDQLITAAIRRRKNL